MIELMPLQIAVNDISELKEAAKSLLKSFSKERIFAFYGEMGAGKTTFIKEICKTLDVIDVPSSPTFSIVNEYKTSEGKKIFHFDFYRIKNEAEAYDLGYEDYFYSGNYCFVEWPEKIENLIPENCVKVNILVENNKRIISAN